MTADKMSCPIGSRGAKTVSSARQAQCGGHSVVEYAILLAVVVAAIVGMRSYLKYAMQGRLNDARWNLSGESALYDPEKGNISTWSFTSSSVTETHSVIEEGNGQLAGAGADELDNSVVAMPLELRTSVQSTFHSTTNVEEQGQ